MAETKKLLNQIEYLRKRMIEVGLEKGITDEESLKISQELDHLLNIFNKISHHKNN